MFERYTEHARRSIFFARYEASMFGSTYIETEHLLLGILRDDKRVASQLGLTADGIRKEIEQIAPATGERVSTSVDLPLSHESKQVLRFAAEEADALNHKHIHTSHQVLGLLRIEDSLAAKLLRTHGVEYERYRETVAKGPLEAEVREPRLEPEARSLEPAIHALDQLVDSAAFMRGGKTYGAERLKRKPWTRTEALGHLIDWAMVHQQWLTRALMESKVTAAKYPDESAVAIQGYAEFSWPEAVDLWLSLNWLLIHVLLRVPEDKANVPCRIGIAEPVPLSKLIDAYVEHCQDIVGQILARLE
jgi:hypothetical protein